MKILDARINWKDGYGNDPHLEVLVDEIPKHNNNQFAKFIFAYQ